MTLRVSRPTPPLHRGRHPKRDPSEPPAALGRGLRRRQPGCPQARDGFTLVEILVAAVLTLLMMLTVVTVFASVSDSIRGSRSTVEMADSLRHTKDRLQADLAGVTVTMLPPRRPENGEGYFEYIEGPTGAVLPLSGYQYELPDGNLQWDSTVGDNDDILLFTTRSQGEPFVGRFGTGTVESQVAEVAWFLRGTTLYRRVLLVAPTLPLGATFTLDPGVYGRYDISLRQEGGALSRMAGEAAGTERLVLNTLGDLTKRENRYAHQPHVFPHDARFWGALGLPTLRESSDPAWPLPLTANTDTHRNAFNFNDSLSQLILPLDEDGDRLDLAGELHPTLSLATSLRGDFDAWQNPRPWDATDPVSGELLYYQNSPRAAEDVILTNVLAFDVKAWDPGAPILAGPDNEAVLPGDPAYVDLAATFFTNPTTPVLGFGAYVDLNYMQGRDINYNNYESQTGIPKSYFYGPGDPRSQLMGHHNDSNVSLNPSITPAAVYDTGSFHYEHDGFNQNRHIDTADFYNYNFSIDNAATDEGTNGFDDDDNGMVDDDGELEAPPPYRAPLRGIQVKIRVFDPSSRQIREVSVVQDFLPQ